MEDLSFDFAPEQETPSRLRAMEDKLREANAPEESVASSSHSSGGRSGKAANQCAVCEELCYGHNRHCRCHKKGYDCEDSDGCIAGTIYAAFVAIFGSDKERKKGAFREEDVANRIVADWTLSNPEGDGKHKVRNGLVAWTQYLHSHGVRQTCEEVENMPKLDQELFVGKMIALRRWFESRSLALWREFDADEDILRDMGGVPWCPKRLTLPSNLFGGAGTETRKGTYEDKCLTHMSKVQKFSEEDCKKIREELDRGFRRPFDCREAVANMHKPMQAQYLTAEGSVQEQETAAELSYNAALQDPCAKVVAKREAAEKDSGISIIEPKKKAAKQVTVTDLKTQRTVLANNSKKRINGAVESLKKDLGAAVIILYKSQSVQERSLIYTVQERVLIGCFYIGCNISLTQDPAGSRNFKFDFIKAKPFESNGADLVYKYAESVGADEETVQVVTKTITEVTPAHPPLDTAGLEAAAKLKAETSHKKICSSRSTTPS